MKAKTTKFLAVLAVLAVAFAGVAVLVQEQTADAAAGEAVTKNTYSDAITAKEFTSIKLETSAAKQSVVLYKYEVKNGTEIISESTKMTKGNAYFFAENSSYTVKVPKDITYEEPIMLFVLDGVSVKLAMDKDMAAAGLIQFVAVSDYDAATGIITLAEKRYSDDKINTLFSETGYAYGGDGTKTLPEYKYLAADRQVEVIGTDKTLTVTADLDVVNGFLFANSEQLTIYEDTTLTGAITKVNVVFEENDKNAKTITLDDFTGKIVYDVNEVKVDSYTGEFQAVPGMKILGEEEKILKVTGYTGGEVLETAAKSVIGLADDMKVVFAENATIGGAFGYIDEYGDVHAVYGTSAMTAGIGGFSIYSDDNMLGLDGTVTLTDNETLATKGNVVVSGMIYTEGKTFGITNADVAEVKIAGQLQILGAGAVTLDNALVLKDSTLYVKDALTVTGILKVAEGAIVKTEGKLTYGGQIWNAGQVITTADSYTDDTKLVRVYMNSNDGTGTFYKGSVEYNGTITAPLAIAYGSYLDITGVCDVNLTSNAITVDNNLYKYHTMILATKNTTIPLTVDYPNQYAADINFSGKQCSTPDIGPKSATIKNVVWESANNALITVVAPEVYTVVLAATVQMTEATAEAPAKVVLPSVAETVWTTGLVVKDPTGRIIPISQPTAADQTADPPVEATLGGEVKLVYGVKYTVTGATSSSNYKFFNYDNVLTDLSKDSQTQGSFTMVRNANNNYTPVENAAPAEVPVVLHITEGKADKITITLTDNNNQIAVGDVILYYTEDDGETVKEVVKPAVGNATFTIFNNSDVYLKFPSIEYYRFVAEAIGTTTTVEQVETTTFDLTVAEVTKDDDMDGWIYKLNAKADDNGKLPTTGKLGVTCELAEVTEKFVLDTTEAEGKSATVTVTFSKWYEGSTVHGAEKVITFDENGEASLKMFEGEVYSLSWTDVPDVWENMSYQVYKYNEDAQDDDDEYVPGVAVKYVAGTSVVVEKNGTIEETDVDRIYTLALDDIEYVKVHNATDKEFTVVCGELTTSIAKAATEDKAAYMNVVETGADPDIKTTYTVDLTLEVIGKTVMSWTYAVYADAEATVPFIKATGVGGPSATIEYDPEAVTVADAPDTLQDCIIRITNLTATPIPFIVKTQPVEHAQLGDYSRVGNYGDNMFVYVSADDTSFSVKDVRVYYENPDKEGFPDYDRGYWLADPSADGKYWTYTMPAENVVLMPKVTKDYYEVTVVDQTGAQVGDKIQVAPETAAKITLPAKPLMYIASAEPTPAIADFVFVVETAEATFTMPNEDVTITATYAESEYSKDVSVTIGQKGQAINVVLYALDGAEIGAGTVTIDVWYTYLDEEGDIMTESVEVTLTYDVEGKTAYVISDKTFIQELGDNYGGAFAVTGTFTLGAAQGEMVRTAYTPVEA